LIDVTIDKRHLKEDQTSSLAVDRQNVW